MNKTISINLGGNVFNVEEHAFQLLKNYLDRIRVNFGSDDAVEEIMADIEGRIAELFQERNHERKNVVTEEDVQQVIAIMGQPEDYLSDDASAQPSATAASATSSNNRRRIFRDADDAVIGGVCSGLSHFLGWDPLAVRLIMILIAFISLGTAILGYIIFWALVPAAITTAEKLQMRGTPVNIDNISRFINEEAKAAAEKVGTFGKNMGKNWKSTSGTLAHNVMRIVSIALGLFFLLLGIALLIGLIVFLGFSEYQFFGFDGGNWEMIDSIIFANDGTLSLLIVGVVLVILAPAMSFLYTAIKLITGVKKRVKGFGLIALALFLVGLILCIYGGVHTSKQFIHDAQIRQEFSWNELQTDTLHLDVLPDDIFIGREKNTRDFSNLIRKQNGLIYYGQPIDVEFRCAKDNMFSMEIEKKSNGRNVGEAANLAQHMVFNYTLSNDSLMLSPYFTTPDTDVYRMQHVDIILYIPEGKWIRFGTNAVMITDYGSEESEISFYQMGKHGLIQPRKQNSDDKDTTRHNLESTIS